MIVVMAGIGGGGESLGWNLRLGFCVRGWFMVTSDL